MRARGSLAAAAVALAAVVAASGAARPEATTATEAATTFVVTGHGWGHGVGMPQYGALGYARKGFSYARILKRFYPGTSLAATGVKQVRVLLAEGAASVAVSSAAPFRIRDAAGKSYKLAAGSYAVGPSFRLRVAANGALKQLPGPLMFTPGRVPLQVGRPYRGSIQVLAAKNKMQAINFVGLEDYVRGVVSQEVSSDWPAPALAAQAVASRTYAVATRKRSGTYDLFADTRSQVYGGVDAEEFSTSAAVDSTAAKILTYGGRPAITYFYASSGGKTASIQDSFTGSKPVPYLVSVRDPYDTLSPYHDWGPYPYAAKTLARKLHAGKTLLDAKVTRNRSSRVSSVTLTTAKGEKTLPGSEVRQLLGLRSTWFSIGALSLVKPSKALTYGVESELTGLARGLKGVRIERLAGRTWRSFVKVSPSSDGTFAATVQVKAPGYYRLTSGKVATAAVKVPVAAYVRLDAQSGGLAGRARPVYPGTTVTIQRLDGSSWDDVATSALDAAGRFTAKLTLQPATYRARIVPGHGLLPGVSAILRVVS